MDRVTRLAPSPTGALHLGNARTFLINWIVARQRGWKVLLRIEDIDGPRLKQGADRTLIEDLAWLGIDWDEGPIYQSNRMPFYTSAISRLVANGRAYPCVCSRKEVETAASAPHAEDGAVVYPGTCRGKYESVATAHAQTGKPAALRFMTHAGFLQFEDQFAGFQEFDISRQVGDFVIAKADGTPSYQLAVVVDDASADVTDVVRGDDLLTSTPKQILLFQSLDWGDRIPRYYHVPLIVGPDGHRLAKRHGDTRLSYYRDRGVPPERVTALLARWCGLTGGAQSLRPRDMIKSFCLEAVPRQPIVFCVEDDAWLRAGAA
jgi:glutamyl-tRNA synthetase